MMSGSATAPQHRKTGVVRWSGSRGMTLTEILIAVAIGGIVIFGALSVESWLQRTSKRADALAWIYSSRTDISRVINNNQAWQRTVTDGANATVLGCVAAKTPCLGAGGPIRLKDQHGVDVPLLSGPGLPADQGVSKTGETCTGFNAAGNPSCPFRITARWAPLCFDGACRHYQAQVFVDYEFADAGRSGIVMQSNRLNFKVIKNETVATASDACVAAGGTYDSGTGTCAIGMTGECPLSPTTGRVTMVIGFTNSGNKMCGDFNPIRCPLGTSLAELRPDGTVRCEAGCLPGAVTTMMSFGSTKDL
ncbi:MAG TPA: prepilin-type N-terminal cleavage/methylation domain-containing protein [Pseudobdellovibrionaceae bacterium]|nr:prepilin-type N-terminal cleavage/methylation domain-containing protein [Pseudobdellovibrionaceae bacterium]